LIKKSLLAIRIRVSDRSLKTNSAGSHGTPILEIAKRLASEIK